jgi:hypothetical protein
MEKIEIRSELRQAICRELRAIRGEFSQMADRPIADWIDG